MIFDNFYFFFGSLGPLTPEGMIQMALHFQGSCILVLCIRV